VNAQSLEKIAELLVALAKTISVIAIAEKLAVATSDDEKCYLSMALAQMMNSNQLEQRHYGSSQPQGPFGQQMF
jgi:hypothetical protein